MQKIIPALTRLQAALDALDKSGDEPLCGEKIARRRGAMRLFTHGSLAMKKTRKALETKQRQAAASVDKALAQIDLVLGADETSKSSGQE